MSKMDERRQEGVGMAHRSAVYVPICEEQKKRKEQNDVSTKARPSRCNQSLRRQTAHLCAGDILLGVLEVPIREA